MRHRKPIYLLAGGRPRRREPGPSLIQRCFTEHGLTSPTVAYIGTANRDAAPFFQRSADSLRAAGAGTVNHARIAPEHADLGRARELLASADAVFVGGGDVSEGIATLKATNMIGVLSGLYARGKLFFGRSAGSIMLADAWVRWGDPDDDSTAVLFPCLGFAPVLCDTHGEDDGWDELKMALQLSPDGRKGYGIVSGTAIKVYPSGRVDSVRGVIHRFIRREGRILRLPDLLPVC